MRYSPVTSPTSSIFGCSGVSVSFSRKVFGCLNLRLELMRAYLLVMLQTLMLTVSSINPRDLLRRRVTWSLMRITAPKWSKVALVIGDEIPPQAIIRMAVGFILPIEEPLVAEGEGQCSTQVEPSPTQGPHASEEQSEGPQPHEQDQGQDHAQDGVDTPSDAQGQVLP